MHKVCIQFLSGLSEYARFAQTKWLFHVQHPPRLRKSLLSVSEVSMRVCEFTCYEDICCGTIAFIFQFDLFNYLHYALKVMLGNG